MLHLSLFLSLGSRCGPNMWLRILQLEQSGTSVANICCCQKWNYPDSPIRKITQHIYSSPVSSHSAFHQRSYALFVFDKFCVSANQCPCLISTELGAPGKAIISSNQQVSFHRSVSSIQIRIATITLELWFRVYESHLLPILEPNTTRKSS